MRDMKTKTMKNKGKFKGVVQYIINEDNDPKVTINTINIKGINIENKLAFQ